MNTQLQTFTYGHTAIAFDLTGNQKLMVNATEMAAIFNKRVENFTRMDSTVAFMEECLKNANSRFLGIETEADLIVSKQRSGTWMHRVLALKFAAWLSPAFELWVYRTTEDVLFGPQLAEAGLLRERARLTTQIKEAEASLADDPRFVHLSNLKAERKQVNHRKLELERQQYSLFFDEFTHQQPA